MQAPPAPARTNSKRSLLTLLTLTANSEASGLPKSLFLREVPFEFHCAICLDVARDATRCADDHVFCRSCISQWLERSETCPIDRAALTIKSLATARIVTNLMSELDIICLSCCVPYCSSITADATPLAPPIPCLWTGKLGGLEAHASQCSNIYVRCSCEGCELRVNYGDLDSHQAVCQHRKEPCMYQCGASPKIINMEAHITDRCPRRPTLCTNTGCGVTPPFAELQAHRQVCLYEQLACSSDGGYEGCEMRIRRGELAAHLLVCVHRKVACFSCGKNVKVCEMDNHNSSNCPRRPSLCPNFGCCATVPFNEMEAHQRVCFFEEVECQYHAAVTGIGTGKPLFQPVKIDEKLPVSSYNFRGISHAVSYIQAITAMPEYADKSVEELRLEDYMKRNKALSEGCCVRIRRGELAAHVSACPHRLKACVNGCGQDVKARDMVTHNSSHCPCRLSQCPNFGCCAMQPLYDMQKHRSVCLFEELDCPYAAAAAAAVAGNRPFKLETECSAAITLLPPFRTFTAEGAAFAEACGANTGGCEGCRVRVLRGELAIHELVCGHRKEVCLHGCGSEVKVPLDDVETHTTIACLHRPPSCPWVHNSGCALS